MLRTIQAIEDKLMCDCLVRRYLPPRTADDLPGEEPTYLACDFWLADAYALASRWKD
ncbi:MULTISPECIES: hypothetical protein [Cupriavidus]|uniref:Uncharacterized protein n=1 Tax=Cupriavidus numazuensis TaxID=221992 RepID=A0ABN7QBH8_9BURK|nr:MULTISPECIES: hypothetical protein [Cupriavidus]CAG2160883.1 hypothetical protein LMG26411_07832 [Cupriavidus numazuensis]